VKDAGILEALILKRNELEGLIQSYEAKIKALETLKSNVRAVLSFQKQNHPETDFLPNMSVRRLFAGGEIQKWSLEALMQARGVLSTRDLTRHVMVMKGLDVEDPVLRKKVVFSVMQSMKTARRHKLVKDAGKRLGVRLWQIEKARRNPSALD
jgi:hypothetical protein